jgi:hypothetical protein
MTFTLELSWKPKDPSRYGYVITQTISEADLWGEDVSKVFGQMAADAYLKIMEQR